MPRHAQRASELQGRPITNNGENFGKIEDMVIDVNSGRIVYGINSFNNVPGSQDRLYPMPWQSSRYSPDGKSFSVDFRADRLQTAPNFPQGQWPSFEDEQFTTKTFRSYNQVPWWERQEGSTEPEPSRPTSAYQARWSERPTAFSRMSELRGRDIIASDGTRVGKIDDIVVDPETGRVLYAIEGSGDKRMPIPWNALRAGTDNAFYTEISADRLRTAPRFEQRNWPNMADQKWAEDLHKYYTVDPYWSTNSVSRDATKP